MKTCELVEQINVALEAMAGRKYAGTKWEGTKYAGGDPHHDLHDIVYPIMTAAGLDMGHYGGVWRIGHDYGDDFPAIEYHFDFVKDRRCTSLGSGWRGKMVRAWVESLLPADLDVAEWDRYIVREQKKKYLADAQRRRDEILADLAKMDDYTAKLAAEISLLDPAGEGG